MRNRLVHHYEDVEPARVHELLSTHLGDVDRFAPGAAITLLDEGLALFDKSFARDRQAYLTHSAEALLRPGQQRDLDTAAARGLEALDIAESLHSTYSVELLRNLYHQMTPHAKVPAVGDFLDRARGLVAE